MNIYMKEYNLFHFYIIPFICNICKFLQLPNNIYLSRYTWIWNSKDVNNQISWQRNWRF